MSEQSMRALALANQIRCAGAQVRRELAVGTLTMYQALRDPRAGSVPIWRMLTTQHRWGPQRASATLRALQISPHRRIMDLTDREAQQIAQATRMTLGQLQAWAAAQREIEHELAKELHERGEAA